MHRPVLRAVTLAALDATGATSAWFVADDGGVLRAIAVAGDSTVVADATVPPGTPVAGAIATGQPACRSVDPVEPGANGAGAFRGVPGWLLTVPVPDLPAAIELARGGDGPAFSIDDIEVVTLLADVAAAAFDGEDQPVPGPDECAAELHRLHRADPDRYRLVATMLTNLFGHA